jgi:hypothetical protein
MTAHNVKDPSAIGTVAWLRHTQGRLSLRERLQLLRTALGPAVRGMVSARWARVAPGTPTELAPLQARLPDTPAVAQALQAMAELGHTAVLQHSWRCHWWGMALGQAGGHQVDEELLLVACLMHDLGMLGPGGRQAGAGAAGQAQGPMGAHGEALLGGCACFTGQSAAVAMQVAHTQGWPAARTLALGDAIALHMNGQVAVSQGVEAHLLQQATACDVIGARLAQLPRGYRQAVLQAHPRGDFDQVFSRFVAGQAREHPGSRAALMHQVGLGLMVKLNPF